jgi:DNA-binding response OmpR family regulator
MENKGIILICDFEDDHLKQISTGLDNEGLSLEVINDASELIPRALRAHPGLLIVNPDMPGFNDYDICKNLMKALNIPVILMVDKNSTARNNVDECVADEVITKPIKLENLINLVSTHLEVSH